MRSASRHFAVLQILPLLALGSSVAAAPVAVDDVQGRNGTEEAAQATLAAPSIGTLTEGLGGAVKAAGPAASSGSDSDPSSSALAAQIIKEAEAGSTGSEPQGKPQRAVNSATHPAANTLPRNQARASEDEWSMREMGKAAVHWLKESIPWLRSDADESGAGKHVPLHSADWSTSPMEGGKTGRSAMAGTMQVPDATGQVPSGPAYNVPYGNATPQATFLDPEQNLVRVAVKMIREVLEHPLTWLVVSLIAVGAIAVKKLDRRPK